MAQWLWWLEGNSYPWAYVLNTWSPVGGSTWERLEVVALSEEACHWGVSKVHASPS